MRTFRPGDRVRLTYTDELMEEFRGRSGVIVQLGSPYCTVKIPGVPDRSPDDYYSVRENHMIYDTSVYELLQAYYGGENKK